jgi:hypothetical protein
MRTTRLALPWTATVLALSTLAGGCSLGARSGDDGLRIDPDIVRPTAAEQRARSDSAAAQLVADEVGPRISVAADFDYSGGSRRVEARFHMYDDAYVVVGHLDAAGRLRIVFPSSPGDDGFVRGQKIYHVPSFFAGFADEYQWRYTDYRYRYHSTASRTDSYDAGLGYVFVVASWRPMRLDRISDGNRWQTYDVADVSYMQDPREAIEELGSLIAGDNREAYTIEYARYSTTNYGTYAFSDFDAVNGGCFGYSSLANRGLASLFFGPFGFTPFTLGYGTNGCGSAYGSYAYYPGNRPVFVAPPIIQPPLGPPVAIGKPIFHQPRLGGMPATHRPDGSGETPVTTSAITTVNNGQRYHRPGLTAEDAPEPRGQGRTHDTNAQLRGVSERPTIQDMVGRRRIDDGARVSGARGAGARDNNPGWANREPASSNRGSSASRGRGEAANTGHSYGGRSADQGTRSSPTDSPPRASSAPRSEPRGETTRSAPARSEPAARPSPPPSASPRSSSEPARKP